MRKTPPSSTSKQSTTTEQCDYDKEMKCAAWHRALMLEILRYWALWPSTGGKNINQVLTTRTILGFMPQRWETDRCADLSSKSNSDSSHNVWYPHITRACQLYKWKKAGHENIEWKYGKISLHLVTSYMLIALRLGIQITFTLHHINGSSQNWYKSSLILLYYMLIFNKLTYVILMPIGPFSEAQNMAIYLY